MLAYTLTKRGSIAKLTPCHGRPQNYWDYPDPRPQEGAPVQTPRPSVGHYVLRTLFSHVARCRRHSLPQQREVERDRA